MIRGKITVPLHHKMEGIVLHNTSINQGTISDFEGKFSLKVGLNDRIEVVAIQNQSFVVLIDQNVINSKRLNIFLNESINQLEEVVVSPNQLLGNIVEDITSINVDLGGLRQLVNETMVIINDFDYHFLPDELSPLKNTAFLEDNMINGLNFVNLFKVIYADKFDNNEFENINNIDYQLRSTFDNQFFKDYMDLEPEQVNNFIIHAETNGLNNSYFKKGKELDLIQLLVSNRENFK